MNETSFKEISEKIQSYLRERDWHENPSRSLAISLVLEATELLEHFQWTEEPVGSKEDLASEIADIFIYAFEIAHNYNIDIPKAIEDKLAHAAKKYPAKDFKSKTAEQKKKAWIKNKMKHAKEGL